MWPGNDSTDAWGPDAKGPDFQQPDISTGDARLLVVERVGRTVVVTLADGRQYEVDSESFTADLPPVGELVPADLVLCLDQAQARKIAARDLMSMIGRRLQSVARLRKKLLEKGHALDVVEQVLEMMQEKGLCSDRQYAGAFCRDVLLTRAVGPRYLVAKLKAQQIPTTVAQAVVVEIMTSELEAELAMKAATARWRRSNMTPDISGVAKVVKFLLGRGFSPQVSHVAARKAQPEFDGGKEVGFEDSGNRM